ncbi:Starch-binding associating with outer membrane [Fodinibius roseus]|uniref:Starch-binding associating with outer membrane n=1 Tax=Fodinibius roseus TaxID=1194090 RepID=A0A1M4YMP9_9BACT|nr:RagB/SusD family nutrient uptake outer membrane protein [Fodinibius roseus]SHF07089.1 Starch-binding associating with outer membrane [Fodinibius roseus]
MKYLKLVTSLMVITFCTLGCTDLSVDNEMNPNTEEALSQVEDIEALVGNQFRQWVQGVQNRGVNDRMTLMGLEMTNGYSFVSDYLKFPQEPFNNSSSYRYNNIVTSPWSNLYTAISSSNDGLEAIDQRGMELATEAETQRMRAFAKFIQGMSYAFLANEFDQAILIDETNDLENFEPELHPYQEVLNFALGKLEDARSIAQQYSFTLPNEWILGNPLTSEEFVRLINSYEARFILQNARTPDDRDNVDWQRIRQLIENGIEEDLIIEADGSVWSIFAGILQGGVFRASYYLIGRTDESGKFEEWRTTPAAERSEFVLETSDKRIAGQETVQGTDYSGTVMTLEARKRAPGTDFKWAGPSLWPDANGGWYGSQYYYHRTDQAWNNGGVGPVPYMRKAEMDLYLAEALLRESEPVVDPEAVELINQTRVERGGLEPVSVNDSFDKVWNAMRYEFDIETAATGGGLAYFTKRGMGDLRGKDWGGLIEGTPLHLPLPAEELDLLGMPHYTFGGAGTEGAAP